MSSHRNAARLRLCASSFAALAAIVAGPGRASAQEAETSGTVQSVFRAGEADVQTSSAGRICVHARAGGTLTPGAGSACNVGPPHGVAGKGAVSPMFRLVAGNLEPDSDELSSIANATVNGHAVMGGAGGDWDSFIDFEGNDLVFGAWNAAGARAANSDPQLTAPARGVATSRDPLEFVTGSGPMVYSAVISNVLLGANSPKARTHLAFQASIENVRKGAVAISGLLWTLDLHAAGDIVSPASINVSLWTHPALGFTAAQRANAEAFVRNAIGAVEGGFGFPGEFDFIGPSGPLPPIALHAQSSAAVKYTGSVTADANLTRTAAVPAMPPWATSALALLLILAAAARLPGRTRRTGLAGAGHLLMLGALVLGGACDRPAATTALAGPSIAFDQSVHDFGVVPEGPPVRHVFKVKNDGSGPLEIQSVSASCGCTAAVMREKIIQPGASGEIEVTFDTEARPGKNAKTVSVISNDPKRPTTTLTINVEVERQLAFEPAQTFIGALAGQKSTREVWLTGKLASEASLKLIKVDPVGPVTVEVVERKTESGIQRGLRIQNDPGRIGNGTVQVALASGLTGRPELTHLVRWVVQGNIEAPDAVELDLGQVGSRERVFRIVSRRPDFRLKAARVIDGPFKADLLPAAAALSQRTVKLTTTLSAPRGTPTLGKLVLESNDPLEPRKQVTLSLAPVGRSAAASKPR